MDQLKYLGSAKTKDGIAVNEVKIRLTQAHSVTTRLQLIFRETKSSVPPTYPKKRLNCKSLVLYVPILLFGCESWTLTADLEMRIKAFENNNVGTGRRLA